MQAATSTWAFNEPTTTAAVETIADAVAMAMAMAVAVASAVD